MAEHLKPNQPKAPRGKNGLLVRATGLVQRFRDFMQADDSPAQPLSKQEAESYDNSAPDFGDKLTEITRKIAEYQGKLQPARVTADTGVIVDPADAFMCDSCQ